MSLLAELDQIAARARRAARHAVGRRLDPAEVRGGVQGVLPTSSRWSTRIGELREAERELKDAEALPPIPT